MFLMQFTDSLDYTLLQVQWVSICPVTGNIHGPNRRRRTASPESHCVDSDPVETTCWKQRRSLVCLYAFLQLSVFFFPVVNYNATVLVLLLAWGLSHERKCFFDPHSSLYFAQWIRLSVCLQHLNRVYSFAPITTYATQQKLCLHRLIPH